MAARKSTSQTLSIIMLFSVDGLPEDNVPYPIWTSKEAPSPKQKLFALIFSIFLPCNKIGFHTTLSQFSFFFPPPQTGRLMGLLSLLNPRCPSQDSSLLCPFLGIFPTQGVGKSDEDDHGSVCTVSGVFTPPGEEDKKRTI